MYNKLLVKWSERLERFKSITDAAKDIERRPRTLYPRLSLDASSARIEVLSECIKELAEYQEALSKEISAALYEIRSHLPEDSLYKYKYVQTVILQTSVKDDNATC